MGIEITPGGSNRLASSGRGFLEPACETRLNPVHFATMKASSAAPRPSVLRILPAYTGSSSIEDVLGNPRAVRLLWLEILVNDQLNLAPWLERAEMREAYAKACRWYTAYRSLIDSVLVRTPLPIDTSPVDPRDYRTFAEALRFVAAAHD